MGKKKMGRKTAFAINLWAKAHTETPMKYIVSEDDKNLYTGFKKKYKKKYGKNKK